MTYDDLRLLIDYNYWARDRVLDAIATITPEQFIRPMGNSFNSIHATPLRYYLHCRAHFWDHSVDGRKAAGTSEAGPHFPMSKQLAREWGRT